MPPLHLTRYIPAPHLGRKVVGEEELIATGGATTGRGKRHLVTTPLPISILVRLGVGEIARRVGNVVVQRGRGISEKGLPPVVENDSPHIRPTEAGKHLQMVVAGIVAKNRCLVCPHWSLWRLYLGIKKQSLAVVKPAIMPPLKGGYKMVIILRAKSL